MSALSEYHDLLLPELPGCTAAMVNLHLRKTARAFCQRTSVWRETLAAIGLVANQATYTMAVPANSEVVKVTSITVNNELLWVDKEAPNSNATKSNKLPKYRRDDPPFTLSADMAAITLIDDEIPTATVTGGLVVIAALKPTAAAAVLPDFLLVEYSDAIQHGTLYRLMRMGKKPWGDRPLAADYESRWNSDLNFAAYQGQVGNNKKSLRVRKWG